eukprot:scaffold1220_cov259-Pinguiococcus_pyrenoidosus.AAC.5
MADTRFLKAPCSLARAAWRDALGIQLATCSGTSTGSRLGMSLRGRHDPSRVESAESERGCL